MGMGASVNCASVVSGRSFLSLFCPPVSIRIQFVGASQTNPAGTISRSNDWRDRAPFRARRWLSGGHVQTIASFLLPRKIHLPPPQERLVEVALGVQVRCWCYWQQDHRSDALTLIVIHGLEGSSDSQYMSG